MVFKYWIEGENQSNLQKLPS